MAKHARIMVRLEPAAKAELVAVAADERRSVARMAEVIISEWLVKTGRLKSASDTVSSKGETS